MKFKNFISDRVWKALPWLWLFGGFMVMMLYHIGPGRKLIDGDMGGEMILADLLNQEGNLLLSDNWYYATEIHVFFMQLVFRPFLLLFPDNWHLVRALSMAVIYVVNIIGYLFLCRQIKAKDNGIWSCAALMWPVGMWRLFLGLYGGQYLVYDFFSCYIIGLLFYLAKKEWGGLSEKKKCKMLIVFAVLAFLSFAGGVNGVRETMMLFMPLCLGVFAVLVFHCYLEKVASFNEVAQKCKKELRIFLLTMAATVFNLAGYGYNVLVLLRKYNFQSNTNMALSSAFSLNNVLGSISEYFGLFGYAGDMKLFSLEGISSACGIIIAIVICLATLRLFFLKKRMSLNQEIIFSTFVCGLFACGVMFGHMKEMNEPRFWLPFMIFGFMVLQIEGDVEKFRIIYLRGIVGIVLAMLVMVASIGTIKTQIDTPYCGRAKNADLAAFLEENEYLQGYCEYWTANAITEMTSGKVQARPMMYSETFEMMAWSNRIDYVKTFPEGKVFYAAYKRSFPGDISDCCFLKYGDGQIILDDNDWLVICFDDVSQMQQAYEIALANGEVKSQAMKVAAE